LSDTAISKNRSTSIDSSTLGKGRLLHASRQMKIIREFEERLHVEIATGEIPGFTHL
jgi:TPP-dependent pyruvate/acetoin dehydrogenase alpha subunit